MDEPDELCAACSEIDLFSLFTGARYFPGDGFHQKAFIPLGTLADVCFNTGCPCCRLLKHDIYGTEGSNLWPQEIIDVDTSKVKVNVFPVRADYHEEMRYIDAKTKDMVATKLEVRLYPLEDLPKKEKDLVRHHHRGNGIQLLSPDFVDPARPLLNGYRATTMHNSLDLLRQWMDGCLESHTLWSKSSTCCRSYFYDAASEYRIRVIDIESRVIVERNPVEIDYAALSYVWARNEQAEATTGSSSTLPSDIPKVIDDAIFVCKRLSIPYLWVDRYCIDQGDAARQASEIQGMGYRYHYAKLTLIAAKPDIEVESEVGLLPTSESGDMQSLQRVETIQGRKYITALPSIQEQIQVSRWDTRAWTMQEGQLSNRCAFFGNYDVSFLCESGHWRESLHSGLFAHEVEMPNIKTDCEGYHILSWLSWVKGKAWKFEEYDSLLMAYTSRNLSFESDKLNAITGCLNLIAEKKGLSFIHGLPAKDFHYALLWTGEYDKSREGFPSWSWPGWHCLQQSHIVYPLESGTCSLEEDRDGNLRTVGPVYRNVELQGLLMNLTERPHRTNKCSQRFANITSSSEKFDSFLTITSEIAHFSLDILPHSEPAEEFRSPRYLKVPHDFDSTSTPSRDITWDTASEYKTPFNRLQLRDDYNNIYKHHYPRWYDNWPPFKLNLPLTLRGGTLAWLLKEGIDLMMILELEILDGDESLRPFHVVLCLGVDRRGDVARRCGMFCLPKDIWERSGPRNGSVTMC